MILGTGVDIIEVDRIRGSYERFGERFVRRILSDSELGYCLAHRDPAPFLAARFAAKEAISKAFGTGIGSAIFVEGNLFPNTELGHLPLRDGDGEAWASARARKRENLKWK